MSRKTKRRILGVVMFLCLVALTPTIWNLYWRVPGRLDFVLHQAQYDRIVRKAKSLPPPAKYKIGHFTLEGVTAYYVCETASQYTITLVTTEWGHFGKVGYVYVDQPPPRRRDHPGSNVDAPGASWMLEGQVAPHWWIVSNHLD